MFEIMQAVPVRGSWLVRLALSLSLTLGPAASVIAQKPQAPNPLAPKSKPVEKTEEAPPPTTQAHELTAADLESFLDGAMPLQLAREDIAGATISVVKDGKLIFSKGYGFADVDKRKPVQVDKTLFRPGSISKLFTWTAVMQQVEQGKLDLDRDVNDYLDFKVPPAYGKPITLRNIMTHTSGFEETIKELFVGDAQHLTPLDKYLKTYLPDRIFAPGTTPAYSNYATTMAGYIVQRVSGEPFDDYIENHIIKPLGMNHTTFRQPLPDNLKDDMSSGYEVASQPAEKFEFVNAFPAGACSTTATDMARFMIAHLQNGEFEGTRILKPETAQLMHSRQYANRPELNAMALGFYEESRNGHRIIGHGGDTEYFHSDLHLVLDANVGFFISYNSAGKGEISPRSAIWEKVLDRYFPYTPPETAQPSSAASDAQSVAGHYIVSRRGEDTILKVFGAFGQTKVSVNDDGSISVSDLKDLNGQPKKFKEIAPLLYREENGQDLVGFKRNGEGRLEFAFDFPAFVFQKSTFFENSAFNLVLIVGAMVIMALALIIWPISAMVRKHYGRKSVLEAKDRRLWIWVRIACILELLFLAGYAIFFTMATKNIAVVSPSTDPLIRLIQLVGWIGFIGMLLALYNAFRAWKTPGRWLWSKLGETAIALACVGWFWFCFYWNLFHWSLRY